MEKIDQNKLKRQLKGLNKLEQNNWTGTIHYTTRVGKRFILCYEGFKRYFNKNPGATVLVLVPSKALVDEWNSEIDKFSDKYEGRDGIQVLTIDKTIHMLKGKPPLKVDWLIADEGDAYMGTVRYEYINGNRIVYGSITILTATLFLIKKYRPELLDKSPVLDKIGRKEAERLSYIGKYVEFNLGIELPEDDRILYDELDRMVKRGFAKFLSLFEIDEVEVFFNSIIKKTGRYMYIPDLDVTTINQYDKVRTIVSCCMNGNYYKNKAGYKTWGTKESWCKLVAEKMGWNTKLNENDPMSASIIANWSPKSIFVASVRLTNSMADRQKLLQLHKLKAKTVLEVLDFLDFPETITFSEKTSFVNLLHRYINFCTGKELAVKHHSNLKSEPIKHYREEKRKLIYDEKQTDFIRYKGGQKKGLPKLFSSDKLFKIKMDKLADGRAVVFCVAKAVGRGFTWSKSRCGITTSYADSRTEYVQNTGRLLGIAEDKSISFLINIYFKNTIETKKLVSRQKAIEKGGNKPRWIDDISEIVEEQVSNTFNLGI